MSSHFSFLVLKPQCLISLPCYFSGKLEKENKRRKSLLLQKAVSELPASNRRQTIIVGELKRSLCEVIFNR